MIRRLLITLILALPAVAVADVRMPAIFGDHMVLQQDIKVPVWGWADPGEKVTVTLGKETAKATADAKGNWKVALPAQTTSSTATTLTVTGKNNLKFEDVLVGDVWVCSGQSNMEFGLKQAHDAAEEMPKANEPEIRLFRVEHKIAIEPQTDVKGTWMVCTPETVGDFSAVGYFFGRELHQTLKRPIGLIGTYWGGMPAQAFTSLSGLKKAPPFSSYVAAFEKDVADYPKNKEAFPAIRAAYDKDIADWNATVAPVYNPILDKWRSTELADAQKKGLPPPPKPAPSRPMPRVPPPPEGAPSTPTVLYNGMIAPLIPYGIKGVIWYQGEANGSFAGGLEYATLFPRMISDWRNKWDQGDFPFLYVQLANYLAPQTLPSEGGWAYVRDSQLKTLSLPKTGMASAIDIGNAYDIHPKDKHDVGLRLALAAKHVAYGQKLVYSGPIYDSKKIKGNKIVLSFTNVGGGLQIGVPPWTPSGEAPKQPTELTGFAIAGANKEWKWAKAVIEGNTVIVSSQEVAAPVAVRYDWANDPLGDLYNKEGLPASPFRTDEWQDPAPPVPVTNAVPATPAPPPAPAAKP